MSENITQLVPNNVSSDNERVLLANNIRSLADRVESGETLSVAWIELLKHDRYIIDGIKAKGISYLEIIGGIDLLKLEMINRLSELEDIDT